jgi:hypothetical protein
VFLHIFAKSGKANLIKSELAEYLKAAQWSAPVPPFSTPSPRRSRRSGSRAGSGLVHQVAQKAMAHAVR